MQADYPSIAVQVASKAAALEPGDRDGERTEAERLTAAVDEEGLLAQLPQWSFLGGYGTDLPATQGARVDLSFTRAGVWIFPVHGRRPLLRRPYIALRALELSGGATHSGGGMIGGGFGIAGALEGMALASVVNSLSARTKQFTTMRLEATDVEVFLLGHNVLPRDAEIRLAEPRAHIRAATQRLRTPSSDPPPTKTGPDGLADQIIRLVGLMDKGLLTADEFAAAKARLLDAQ